MVATLEEQSGELWADCHVAVAQGIEQVLYKMGEGDDEVAFDNASTSLDGVCRAEYRVQVVVVARILLQSQQAGFHLG